VNDRNLIEALRRDARDENSDVRQKVARILTERSDVESLNILVDLAGDPDWRVRKAAIEGLEANPTEEVLKALIPALYDQANAGRRNAASEALRVFGARALPYLLYELDHVKDADSKIALATVLGEIEAEESAASLAALVASNPDVNVAATAIIALGRLRRPETVPALTNVLAGENAWLHYHAIEALGRLRATEALPAIVAHDQNPALKKAILEAAGSIGGYGAIDFLASRLAGTRLPDFPLLRAFVTVDEAPRPSILARPEKAYLRRKFRENAPEGAAAALELALKKTERPDRKNDLLRALGWLGQKESLPLLLANLSSDFTEAAQKALDDFGPAAEAALLSLLSPEEDEAKVEVALSILQRRPGADALFPALGVLEHDSPTVRRRAVELLGRLGDPRAVDYLMAHLGDGDAGVDSGAVDALTAIGRQHPDVVASLGARLVKTVAASDPLTRANSLQLLFETGAEDFRARVSTASKDKDPVVRARAVALAARSRDLSLAPIFEHALADENAHVRQAAVAALSASSQARHRTAVAASLQDDDLWVRAAACRSLGAYGSEEFIPRLVEICRAGEPPERIAALEALGQIGGEKAWEGIAEAIEDPDGEIRQAALAAAAELRLPQADSEIERRASDPDWRLRATALEAMGKRKSLDRRPLLRKLLREDPDDLVARSALTALESLAQEEDISHLVQALSRESLADDTAGVLYRLRGRFGAALERAWREAEPRRAAILAEILRGGVEP
jgi:HEAT repeat protein